MIKRALWALVAAGLIAADAVRRRRDKPAPRPRDAQNQDEMIANTLANYRRTERRLEVMCSPVTSNDCCPNCYFGSDPEWNTLNRKQAYRAATLVGWMRARGDDMSTVFMLDLQIEAQEAIYRKRR